MPSEQEHARSLVHEGATGEMHFTDGLELPPSPLIAIAVDDETVRFFWLADENEHALDLLALTEGDDGDVLATNGEGDILRIWGLWEDEHVRQMGEFVAAVRAGTWPRLGLDDAWTRYKELE